MKQLRRLDLAPKDPYGRAQKSPLRHIALTRAAFDALQEALPDHIASDTDGVLIAQPYQGAIRLQYAFPNSDAFARNFPALFGRLLPALSAEETPLGIRLRHTDAASRPYIQPVLAAHAFEIARDWLRMELRSLPEGTAGPKIGEGFALREASVEDAEAIAELDQVAFPTSWLTPASVRDSVAQGGVFRVIEDGISGRAAGFLRLRDEDTSTGYIADIALHPDYQGRGLGEAAMRWALARFRDEGRRAAALTVSSNNGGAIALYRKLGFNAVGSGVDYHRPIDEDEVRAVLEKNLRPRVTVRRRRP